MKFKFKKLSLPAAILLIIAAGISWYFTNYGGNRPAYSDSVAEVPPFSGQPYVVINDNQPEFTEEDLTTEAFEYFSSLDRLERCGYVMSCVGTELMPTQERESISHIKPSGWMQGTYAFVDGKSLYNRCHLIGFQLTGENDNPCNLITGTRYCNVEGMLPFENMIADYIKETDNHVLYRVTPIFHGQELVARGIQMEAYSVEDSGEGICFHVYVYNNQPGVTIDYATGENWSDGTVAVEDGEQRQYILNINSMKFHDEDCSQGQAVKEGNKQTYTGSREALLAQGYEPAGCCNP